MSINAVWPPTRSDKKTIVLAHRGGKGAWRENTVNAFEGALALGADGVELDVRLAGDGTVVVHHDESVAGLGPVAALQRAQLPRWMTTLSEALAACGGAFVNVEIKNSPLERGYDPDERLAAHVVRTLCERLNTPVHPSFVVVSSFSPAALGATRRAADEAGHRVPTGLLVHPALDPGEALEEAKSLGCASLHPFHLQVDSQLVDRAHRAGLAVVAWTVNSGSELLSVLAAGADGVITDDVRGVLEALGR